MGLLSTEAKTAISSGNKISQRWNINAPQSATASFPSDYQATAIQEMVIDAGSRTQSAYNVSLRDLGDLDAGEYVITVDVSNGRFNNSAGGYFYNTDTSYAAEPQQCILQHIVEVTKNDGYTEQICNWSGRITKFTTESTLSASGVIKQTTGTITARPVAADILERKWGVDDKHVVGNQLPDSLLNNMVFVEDNIDFEGTYVDHSTWYEIGWNYALTAHLTNEGAYKVFASIEVLEDGIWTIFNVELTTVTPNAGRLSRTTYPEHASTSLPEEGRISFWVYQDGWPNRGALVRPPKTPTTVWYL